MTFVWIILAVVITGAVCFLVWMALRKRESVRNRREVAEFRRILVSLVQSELSPKPDKEGSEKQDLNAIMSVFPELGDIRKSCRRLRADLDDMSQRARDSEHHAKGLDGEIYQMRQDMRILKASQIEPSARPELTVDPAPVKSGSYDQANLPRKPDNFASPQQATDASVLADLARLVEGKLQRLDSVARDLSNVAANQLRTTVDHANDLLTKAREAQENSKKQVEWSERQRLAMKQSQQKLTEDQAAIEQVRKSLEEREKQSSEMLARSLEMKTQSENDLALAKTLHDEIDQWKRLKRQRLQDVEKLDPTLDGIESRALEGSADAFELLAHLQLMTGIIGNWRDMNVSFPPLSVSIRGIGRCLAKMLENETPAEAHGKILKWTDVINKFLKQCPKSVVIWVPNLNARFDKANWMTSEFGQDPPTNVNRVIVWGIEGVEPAVVK